MNQYRMYQIKKLLEVTLDIAVASSDGNLLGEEEAHDVISEYAGSIFARIDESNCGQYHVLYNLSSSTLPHSVEFTERGIV